MLKNLGQHFLTSEAAIRAAVTTLACSDKDMVVEIGPGSGALTKPLLKCSKHVVAIEKDPILATKLKEEYENTNLSVVEGDIRDFNPVDLGLTNYLLIGNIPYYITGRILRIVLSSSPQPRRIVFIMQKEVAERIVAKDGKESILSISVKAYGNPKYIKTIKRGSFSPSPRVDSALLLIDKVSKEFFKNINEKEFFDLVRKGFAHKRKTLRNNLSVSDEILNSCNIEPRARAETLTLDQWKCLFLSL